MSRTLAIGLPAIAAVGYALYSSGAVAAPDAINGTLESLGGLFIFQSVQALYKAKVVKGVSWMHVAFFSTWGLWNLYYYPALNQWFSFVGGAFLVAVNCFWLGQIVYYSWHDLERQNRYGPSV